ncbi:UbiA family prenyltransferase [Pseudoduganella danionis]|uniref:UbiA family prenyltransferase n=1 Tax=Pseudoduganella danionis TaxID=1890295 RepID=UPI0035E71357
MGPVSHADSTGVIESLAGAPAAGSAQQERIVNSILSAHNGPLPLLQAMRPRQWLKNLLVFAPMLAGHALTQPSLWQSVLAFVAFSLCASGAYLLNDAQDVEADRLHPVKRLRPIAAGRLSPARARTGSAVLVLAALSLAWLGAAGLAFFGVIVVYFLLTLAYSLYLKRLLMVDIVMLAILYTLRILGGAASTGIELSFWLLTFSFFLFLSLALLKRHSELQNLRGRGQERSHGRGYAIGDSMPIGMMGMNSAFLSVLIFALYFNSANVIRLYQRPAFLFAVLPLLIFWLGRMWLLSFRGVVNEDPLLYVSRDPVSLLVIALSGGLCIMAS